MDPTPTIANRFTLHELLGRGGMGDVYRATDSLSGESVAIKALTPSVLAHDPDLVARFLREGEALRLLNHPNIVHMVAAVADQGRQYIAMEFVEGGSLQDVLQTRGSLPPADVLKIALEVADALTRAHHLGIIHRDIKPANVLLAKDGTPRLADFGIAHLSGDSPLTQTGMLIGTIDYLSPELCQGERPGEISDIWAFGVLLFQLLSGRLPFPGETLSARLTAILTEPVPQLANLAPQAPPALADLVQRMLEKDPRTRIPSMRMIAAELEGIQKGRAPLTPTPVIHAHPAAPAIRSNLPAQLTPFIGRAREIIAVRGLLRNPEVRLVTLTGAGGTGKTRLSLQIAAELVDEYEHGIWFVELAAISNPALVLPTIASLFKVKESGEISLEQALHEYLAKRQLLLVIDNFEQVISAAIVIGKLLAAAPSVKVLVSSREVLRLRGEHDYPVPPLGLPETRHRQTAAVLARYEAIALFAQRARAANPAFELSEENAASVAEICLKLEGLPLAIELAAARSRMLRPAAMLERLQNRLQALTGGGRDLPRRQQTIRGAIDWSYELLDIAEKVLFARLGVFIGGWTLESAEAVCGDESGVDVLGGLESLLDKSLLRQFDGVSGATRFTMLETIREYAFEKLQQSGELARLQEAHAQDISRLLEKVNQAMNGPEETPWFEKLDDELENLRAAVAWALTNEQPGLAFKGISVFDYWYRRRISNFNEPLGWLERALAMPASGPNDVPAERAWALVSASYIKSKTRDIPPSILYAEAALALFREIGDRGGISESLKVWGEAELAQQNHELARQLLEQSLAAVEVETYQTTVTLNTLAIIESDRRNYQTARDYFQRAREMSQRIGSDTAFSFTDIHLSHLALQQGELMESIGYCESALKAKWIQTNLVFRGCMCGGLGYVYGLLDNNPEARRRLSQSLEAAVEALAQGLTLMLPCLPIEGQAYLELADGRAKRAAQLFGAASTLREKEDYRRNEFERPFYEAAIAETRAAIGGDAFDALFKKGQAMTIEEAVAFAIQQAEPRSPDSEEAD